MIKRMNFYLFIWLILLGISYGTFKSTSNAESTLSLIKCSTYNVIYLDNYLQDKTKFLISEFNNKINIKIMFPFKIKGFVYILDKKGKLHIYFVNNSKDFSAYLFTPIYKIAYTWYDVDCDYLNQLNLLSRQKNNLSCSTLLEKFKKLNLRFEILKNDYLDGLNDIILRNYYLKYLKLYNEIVDLTTYISSSNTLECNRRNYEEISLKLKILNEKLNLFEKILNENYILKLINSIM